MQSREKYKCLLMLIQPIETLTVFMYNAPTGKNRID